MSENTNDDIDLFDWSETNVESKSRADEMFAKFKEYHKKNPHVWEMFKKYSFELIDAGIKRHSARVVIERIRWQTTLQTDSEQFKIPNNHITYYARLFHAKHPDFDQFFQTNKRVSEDYVLKTRHKAPEVLPADAKKESSMMNEMSNI